MARATTAEMARRCRGWEKALLDSGDEIGAEEHHHWADRLTELAAEVETLRGLVYEGMRWVGLSDSVVSDDWCTRADAALREKEQPPNPNGYGHHTCDNRCHGENGHHAWPSPPVRDPGPCRCKWCMKEQEDA